MDEEPEAQEVAVIKIIAIKGLMWNLSEGLSFPSFSPSASPPQTADTMSLMFIQSILSRDPLSDLICLDFILVGGGREHLLLVPHPSFKTSFHDIPFCGFSSHIASVL